jgi:MFS family permease
MEGLAALVLILVIGVTLIAMFSVLSALFPRLIGRSREIAEASPKRSFIIGAVNGVFSLAVIAALSALAEQGAKWLALPTVLLLVLLVIGLAIGLATMVQVVGARLFPDDGERRQVAKGSAVLILACLTPFVGWFGLLTYIALVGLGAFVAGFFPGHTSEAPSPDPA